MTGYLHWKAVEAEAKSIAALGSIPKMSSGEGKDKQCRDRPLHFSISLTRGSTFANSSDLSSGPGPHHGGIKSSKVLPCVHDFFAAAAAATMAAAAAAAAAGSRRRPLPPLSHMPMHIHASM